MAKCLTLLRGMGGPLSRSTASLAYDPGSQLFGTLVSVARQLPSHLRQRNSLRGGRHLAADRGRPLGRMLRGMQRESAAESAPSLGIALLSLGGKAPAAHHQDFCKKLQLRKKSLKMTQKSSSGSHLTKGFQSHERMRMSRNQRGPGAVVHSSNLSTSGSGGGRIA